MGMLRVFRCRVKRDNVNVSVWRYVNFCQHCLSTIKLILLTIFVKCVYPERRVISICLVLLCSKVALRKEEFEKCWINAPTWRKDKGIPK